MANLENQIELVKGEWYLIKSIGRDLCLLQYNDDEDCTGWWDGTYGEYCWSFSKGGLGSQTIPAPLELLEEKGLVFGSTGWHFPTKEEI